MSKELSDRTREIAQRGERILEHLLLKIQHLTEAELRLATFASDERTLFLSNEEGAPRHVVLYGDLLHEEMERRFGPGVAT